MVDSGELVFSLNMGGMVADFHALAAGAGGFTQSLLHYKGENVRYNRIWYNQKMEFDLTELGKLTGN